MRQIALTGWRGRGQFALVSDEDYDYLVQWKWHLSDLGYVRAGWWVNERVVTVQMGRVVLERILGRGLFPGEECDHISANSRDRGVKLEGRKDNRRENLRIASRSQQLQNSADRLGSSNYRGVHWDSWHQKWVAKGNIHGRDYSLGSFDSEEEAARAYDAWAREHLDPEFRVLNFPEE